MSCCDLGTKYEKLSAKPGKNKVTIIGFWPLGEYGAEGDEKDLYENKQISCCYYRAACMPCEFDLQIVTDIEEVVIPPGIPVVALEEPFREGTVDMKDFKHPPSATYIIGNTIHEFPSDYFDIQHRVSLTVPDQEMAVHIPFYGSQIASIIWYDRHLKGYG